MTAVSSSTPTRKAARPANWRPTRASPCCSTGRSWPGRSVSRAWSKHVTDAEADAYYATRPRISRLGAWASAQSRPLAERADLERRLADYEAKYPGEDIPRPPYWSGYRVIPRQFRVLAEHAVPPARPTTYRTPAARRPAAVGPWQAVPLTCRIVRRASRREHPASASDRRVPRAAAAAGAGRDAYLGRCSSAATPSGN